jgi:hypothetical protein
VPDDISRSLLLTARSLCTNCAPAECPQRTNPSVLSAAATLTASYMRSIAVKDHSASLCGHVVSGPSPALRNTLPKKQRS